MLCSSKNERLQEVTFWKGIAIMMVILTHSHQMFSLPLSIRLIPMFGQMGCQVFFVLSCFGLCLSYERNSPNYFDFIKRRLRSISTGYWLAIVISVSLALISVNLFGDNIFHTCTSKIKVFENVLLLHGLDPSLDGNNRVVRGGWFVGTIVFLYALFPLLYACYSKIAKKVVLPVLVFCSCFALLLTLYFFDDSLYVRRGSFLYFSFVNQLPSFAVGFLLYDWYKNGMTISKRKCFVGVFLLLISFFVFHSPSPVSYIVLPFIFSLSFYYIYSNFTPPIYENANKSIDCILLFGKNSYAVYLTHVYLAFDASTAIISVIRIPEWLLYLLWLPILYLLSLIIGRYYQSLIERINFCVNRIFSQ